MEIFDKEQGDIKIGEYLRNYHSKAERTFFPFKAQNGKWYALYSEIYHRTYVMSLPDCQKIAECNTHRPDSKFDKSGFCPAEYWVPSCYSWEYNWDQSKFPDKPEKQLYWSDFEDEEDFFEFNYNETQWVHLNFGFVYGCYWGGEYYIQKIDLSKIEDGVVNISNPFYPCELPNKIKNFSDVIDIYQNDNEPSAYGVGVLGKFYRFHEGTNDVMTDEEEIELYKKWSEQSKRNEHTQ